MNTKRLMSAIVAMILVICTLLTSCQTADNGNDANTSSSTTTAGGDSTNKDPDGTTAGTTTGNSNLPDDPANNCKHETTAKKNVKEASCTVKGYSGDDVCTACGIIVSEGQETDLINHTYDSGKTTKNPTCIEEGTVTFTCTSCGATQKNSVAKVPHNDIYHDFLDGTHSHTCEYCTLSENAAHTPTNSGVKYAADCDSAEYTEYTCSLCNGVYKVYTEGSVALGCFYGEWSVTVEPTCSQDGTMSRTCTRCYDVETISVPKNDASHDYKLSKTFPATCTDEGSERYSCSYCNDGYTITLQKLSHNYIKTETGSDGWTHKLCECGFKLSTFDAKNLIEAELKPDAIPENNSFEVSLEKADIVFPDSVVSQFKDSNSALSIKADVMSDEDKSNLIGSQNSNLTDDQKNRLADVPIYDFGVKLGGNYVESFNSDVTVTLPYTLKEGEDPEGIIVWYVKEDGTVQDVQAIYDDTTKTVSFSVSHFSFYAIAYEETQEMRCKRGNHEYYATPVVVDASCTQHGYTLYECECCHYKQISDIKEKLTHKYGNVIQPTVDCENGGYTHRICEDCGDTVYIDYVRAKGHTPDSAATCEKASVCTACGNIVIPAKSHSFSDWETVKQSTATEEGMKRRYCSNCGKEDEKAIPPTGLAEKIDFESYGDLYNYIFRDLLLIEGGTFTVGVNQTMGSQKNIGAYDFTIESDGTNYSILIEQTNLYSSSNESPRESTSYILIRNGMVFNVNQEDDGSYVYINTMDSANVEEELKEGIYDVLLEIDSYSVMMFEFADAFVTFGNLFPKQINEYFTAAGLKMDTAEFEKHVNTLKAEYAYIMSLFSFETEIKATEGTAIGGFKNIVALITDIMTSNGNGNYSYAVSSLLNAAKLVVDAYDANAERHESDVIYDFIKDDLIVKFPELKNWADCEAKIRASFPGTMKFSEAADKILTSVCGNDSSKLDSVYESINTLAKLFFAADSDFDIEQVILNYSDYTLDRYAQEILELESFKMMLDNVFKDLNTTLFKEIFGYYRTSSSDSASNNYPSYDNEGIYDTPMGYSSESSSERVFVENELITLLRQYVYCCKYSDDSKLTITTDSNGMLSSIGFKLSVEIMVDAQTGEPVPVAEINPSDPTKYTPLNYLISLEFKSDKNAKITLPSSLESVKDYEISYNYDSNGNIVINTSGELEFDISGSTRIDIGTLLVKDNEMSAEKGFDVYVPSSEDFWESQYQYGDEYFVKYNGKLYAVDSSRTQSYYSINANIEFKDLISDPSAYLKFEGSENDGYIEINNEKIPVYNSAVGLVYQENGEWMLINDQYLSYKYYYEEGYNPITGSYERKQYKLWYDYNHDGIVSAKLTDIVPTFSLSNTSSMNYSNFYENGVVANYNIQYLNFSVNHESWKNYTIRLIGYFDADGSMHILDATYHQESTQYYIAEEVDASKYSGWEERNELGISAPLYDRDGNLISNSLSLTSFAKEIKVPTYYVKIENTFIKLSNLRAIGNMPYEEITLPDSSKLYVVFANGSTENGILYGYTNFSETLYAETACIFENGTLANKVFRYKSDDIYYSFSNAEDISKYITKNGNSYVISAELINKYTEMCKSSSGYSSFYIYASQEWEDGNTSYKINLTPYRYYQDSNSSGDEYYLDWYLAFSNISYDYYTINVNNDGSLSFYFGDGSKVSLEFDGNNWVRVQPEMLETDEKLSASTGLNVGSTIVTDTYSQSYLHVDGKYYNYTSYSILKSELVGSIDELMHDNFKLSNLYYRYDFTDESGKTYKIYQGSIVLNPMDYFGSEYIELFFTVDNGKLMVLRGAEELGESVLKFEEIVSYDDYLNSLVFVSSTYERGSWTLYLNGAFRTVHFTTVTVYESAADAEAGKYIDYLDVYYYSTANGNMFIKNLKYDNENGRYIKKLEIATLPQNIVKIEDREEIAYNGIFTISSIEYAVHNKKTYIEIDGTYYYYDSDSSWSCYQNYRLNEDSMLSVIGDLSWKYAVEKYVNGSWGFYLCDLVTFEKDQPVISNIGDKITVYGDYKSIGYTENGEYVVEISVYTMPDNIVSETRPDGTIFYSKDGQNTGVLKCPDGYYLRAKRIERADGSTYIVCTDLGIATIRTDTETLYKYLESYITYTQGGTGVNISKDIVSKLEKLFGSDIYDIYLRLIFESDTGRYQSLDLSEILRYLGY